MINLLLLHSIASQLLILDHLSSLKHHVSLEGIAVPDLLSFGHALSLFFGVFMLFIIVKSRNLIGSIEFNMRLYWLIMLLVKLVDVLFLDFGR